MTGYTHQPIDAHYRHYSKQFRQAFAACKDMAALVDKTKEMLTAEIKDAGDRSGRTIRHIIDKIVPAPEKIAAHPETAVDRFCETITHVTWWDSNLLARPADSAPYQVTPAAQEMLSAVANEFHARAGRLMRGSWRDQLAQNLSAAYIKAPSIP